MPQLCKKEALIDFCIFRTRNGSYEHTYIHTYTCNTYIHTYVRIHTPTSEYCLHNGKYIKRRNETSRKQCVLRDKAQPD